MLDNSLESFLEEEKHNFCKWYCKRYKLNALDRQCSDHNRYDNFKYYKEKIELCNHCQIDNFIRELRDRRVDIH